MPPQPVIAVVIDQPDTWAALGADLRRRYGADSPFWTWDLTASSRICGRCRAWLW